MVVARRPLRFAKTLRVSAAVASVLVLCAAQMQQQWVSHRPSLKSQVQDLQMKQAQPLLSLFCINLADTSGLGLTCETQTLGSEFTDIVDNRFHPQGIIAGHFQYPHSEDAIVSGWSAESHPYHWGGTLLLSRKDGVWSPVWYRSGLVTSFCEKADQPDGREILLCEFEDAGMGHRYHTLYTVDSRRPAPETPPLAFADSLSNGCVSQKQVMEPVRWAGDRRSFSVEIRTTAWEFEQAAACGSRPPRRPPASAMLEFTMTNNGPHPVSTTQALPATASQIPESHNK